MSTTSKSAAAQFLQEAGKSVSDALDTARNGVSRATGQASDYLKSPEAAKLVPYLLAGGGAAALGGLATGKRKKRSGETRLSYAGRVLRNALMSGGLAAGGSYLVHQGLKKTVGTFDKDYPITGGEGQQGPAAAAVKNLAFSPATAGVAGVGALAATANRPLLGTGKQQEAALKQLLAELKAQPGVDPSIASVAGSAGLNRVADKNFSAFDAAMKNGGADVTAVRQALAREAGVSMHDPKTARGIASRIIRRPVGSLLGQTGGQRVKRLGVGGVAALLPALIGSLTTDSTATK